MQTKLRVLGIDSALAWKKSLSQRQADFLIQFPPSSEFEKLKESPLNLEGLLQVEKMMQKTVRDHLENTFADLRCQRSFHSVGVVRMTSEKARRPNLVVQFGLCVLEIPILPRLGLLRIS